MEIRQCSSCCLNGSFKAGYMVESSEGSVANGRFAAVTAKKECLGTGPDIVRTCRPYCAKTAVCLSHDSCELLLGCQLREAHATSWLLKLILLSGYLMRYLHYSRVPM